MALADIHLRTGALRDFAGNNQLDIDVESIRQLPAVAGQGKSLMEEGTAFHGANTKAGEAIVTQFENIRRLQYGIRDRAEQARTIYVTGEHKITQRQQSVEPFAKGQAEPVTPTQAAEPTDPTVLV
jgi:hypothetical protein